MPTQRFVLTSVVLLAAGTLALWLGPTKRLAPIEEQSELTSGRLPATGTRSKPSPRTNLATQFDASEPKISPRDAATSANAAEASAAAARAYAADEALAAIAQALAATDAQQRTQRICAAIATWAATDIDAAGAWSLAPTAIDRRTALDAAIRGGAAADPIAATRFVGRLPAESPGDTLVLGHELILALAENGRYSAAAAWATAGRQATPAWINDAYTRWASVDHDAALASAAAIVLPAAREVAISAVTNAPVAMAEARATKR